MYWQIFNMISFGFGCIIRFLEGVTIWRCSGREKETIKFSKLKLSEHEEC